MNLFFVVPLRSLWWESVFVVAANGRVEELAWEGC